MEEGDAGAIETSVVMALLDDDARCDEIIEALDPDSAAFCAEHGLPSAPFLLCQCDKPCLWSLMRDAEGPRILTGLLERLAAAHSSAPTPRARSAGAKARTARRRALGRRRTPT